MNQAAQQPSTTDASGEVVVILDLQFKAGTSDIVERTLLPAIQLTRSEEGNLDFQFFKVKDSADRYLILERWTDQSALDWHWQQEYTKVALALFEKYLTTPLSPDRDVTHLIDIVPKK